MDFNIKLDKQQISVIVHALRNVAVPWDVTNPVIQSVVNQMNAQEELAKAPVRPLPELAE